LNNKTIQANMPVAVALKTASCGGAVFALKAVFGCLEKLPYSISQAYLRSLIQNFPRGLLYNRRKRELE
jgi:hypothetical protein